jgi:hypothetical protein
VGYTTKIATTTYSPGVAFLNYESQTNYLTKSTTSVTFTIQTFFLLGGTIANGNILLQLIDTSTAGTYTYKTISSMTSAPLIDDDIVTLPSSFLALEPTGTLSVSSVSPSSPVQYTVNDTALPITFGEFSYSVSCGDIEWTYVAALTNGNTWPSFITLTGSAGGGGTFTVETDDNST